MTAPPVRTICEDFLAGFCPLDEDCPLLHREVDLEAGETIPDAEALAAEALAATSPVEETAAEAEIAAAAANPPANTPVEEGDTADSPVEGATATTATSKAATATAKVPERCEDYANGFCILEDECPRLHEDPPVDGEVADAVEEIAASAGDATAREKERLGRQKEIDELPDEPEEMSDEDENGGGAATGVILTDPVRMESKQTADEDAGGEKDKEVCAVSDGDSGASKDGDPAKSKETDEMPHTSKQNTPAKRPAQSEPVAPKRSRKLSFSRRPSPFSTDEITPVLPPGDVFDEIMPAFTPTERASDARETPDVPASLPLRPVDEGTQDDDDDDHPHLREPHVTKEVFDKQKYHCRVCKRDCNTPSNYNNHIRGRAHKQAVLKARIASGNTSEDTRPPVRTFRQSAGATATGAQEAVHAMPAAVGTPAERVQTPPMPGGGALQERVQQMASGAQQSVLPERVPPPGDARVHTGVPIEEVARAASSDPRVPPTGAKAAQAAGGSTVPLRPFFVEDRVPVAQPPGQAPGASAPAASESEETKMPPASDRHNKAHVADVRSLADGVVGMSIDSPAADAISDTADTPKNDAVGPPGMPPVAPTAPASFPGPFAGPADGTQRPTLAQAGTAAETQDSALRERMTRSHWRELKEACFAAGEVEALTFKILQEFLLSPSVGIGSQHLGPLSDAIARTMRVETSSDGSRHAVFDSLPRALSGDAEPDARLSKAEQDAVACFGDNLLYTFWLRSKEETGDDRVRRDEELPMRGTFPRSPGVPMVYERHDESVPADRLYQRIGRR